MENKNIIIIMSGGTTCVINATLSGIVEEVQKSNTDRKVFVGIHGIHGILKECIVNITNISIKDLSRLYNTPASGFSGTSRIKSLTIKEIKKIEGVFDRYDIGILINIGGNGTICQSILIAESLKDNIKIIALPKTVDNDFGDSEFSKMYFTPGFPSCVKYWNHKIKIFNQENIGACQHDKVLVLQTFGRETGFLAGCARLADVDRKLPLIILLPEDQRPLNEVLEKIKHTINKFNRAIVIMSEGYKISELGDVKDFQGQTMYGSSKNNTGQLLVNHLMDNGIQARAFIPGFDQRDEILLASSEDLFIAKEIGKNSIKNIDKNNNFLVTINNKKRISTCDLKECVGFSRTLPDKWIKIGCFDVTDKYVDYLKSIIKTDDLNGLIYSTIPKFIRSEDKR